MHQETRQHSYRLRPYYRNVGIGCTVLFLAAWIGSVLAAYLNTDGSFPRPVLAMAFMFIVWGGFTLLGVWLVLSYYRYRLFFSDSTISQTGVFQNRSIRFDEIQSIQWRRAPAGGSCMIKAIDQKIAIEFSSFTSDEKADIICRIRESCQTSRQSHWEAFHDRFLVTSPARLRQQQTSRRVLIVALYGHAVIFAGMGLMGAGYQFLVVSLLNLVIAIWASCRWWRKHEQAIRSGETAV